MQQRICVCGLKGSGKSSISKALCNERDGLVHIELSGLIRTKMRNDGIPAERIYEYATYLRQRYGPEIISKMALELTVTHTKNVLIDGLRTKEEFALFNSNNSASIILITSPQETRYSRIINRARPTDPTSLDGLYDMDRKSIEIGMGRVFSMADYVVTNDREFNYAVTQANAALEQILRRV